MSIQFYHDPRGDPKTLLVVNSVGLMRRLYTPFRVRCIVPVEGITKDTLVYVDAVLGSIQGDVYFLVFEKPYRHIHFQLLIKF